MKPEIKKKKTYIKLPRYVGMLMMSIYRAGNDNVICIPECPTSSVYRVARLEEMLYECLRLNLVKNSSLNKTYSPLSCSDIKMNLYLNEKTEDGEDYRNFFAFELPQMIMTKSGWVKTDGSFQLTRPGTQAFRQLAKHLFWESLELHVKRDRKNSITNSISQFCARHGIDYDDCENIIRSYRRERTCTEKTLQSLFCDRPQ